MEAARDLLRLLDQPPSEAAWAAFAEAAEKLPDSALEGLLPEMLARLASWPDHLRISKPEWESRGNNLLNALCRIFPITPALNLSDVFNQELEEILEAQKESIENGTFDDTVLDAGGAHFMSKKRIVRGIHFDQASKVIFALQSDYFVFDQDNLDPGYDHLFRINFQKGSCLRMRTFTRSNYFDTTDCLLIEAIGPDRVLVVTAAQRDEWVGHASIFLIDGQSVRFEHHFEGQHERWVEIPQLERQSMFRYAAEQGCLWGWLHTGEIIRLDVNTAQLTSEKVKLNKVVDITPLVAGLLLAESGGRLCYVDGDIKCSSMATMSHGDSTCLIDLCKWLDYDEYDREEAHPGRLHTPYLLRCRAGIPEPTELAFMKVYHRRTNWTGRHLQFKVRQAGTAWRLAFLDPPNFESIVVVELPSGHGASLEMEDNLLTDGKAGFDFDTTGQVIVFQKGLSFACWKFELLPGCLPERFRVTQVPDAI